MSDGSLIFDTKLDTVGFDKGIGNLQTKSSGALKGIATAIAAITAAFGLAAKSIFDLGSNFETAFKNTSTIFGDVEVNTENLTKKIIDLSNETGIASTELTESLYNALSSGIPVTEDMGDAVDFMAKSIKLSKAGFTDIDTAVTSVSKVLNAYGLEVSETEKIQNLLLKTQNNGITTVNELGSVLAGVTPTASALNVDFENLSTSLAVLTKQGTPTSQAVTQLNALFSELGKSGTKSSKALTESLKGTQYVGKSFSQLAREGVPLNKILKLMSDYAEKNNLAMIDLFSSSEASRSAIALSGKGFEDYTNILGDMTSGVNILDDAYDKVTDTIANKVDIMKENAKNFQIILYENMKEPLKNLANDGIEYINQLQESFKLEGMSGVIKQLGVIIADILLKIVESTPELITAVGKFILGFVEGISNSSNKILGSAIDLILGIVKSISDNFPKIMQLGIDLISNFLDGIGDKIPLVISTILDLITNLINSVVLNLPKILELGIKLIWELTKGIVKTIPELIKQIGNLFNSINNTFNDFLPKMFDLGKKMILKLWEGIKSLTSWISDKIGNFIGNLFGKEKITANLSANLDTRSLNLLPQQNKNYNITQSFNFANQNMTPSQIMRQSEFSLRNMVKYGV